MSEYNEKEEIKVVKLSDVTPASASFILQDFMPIPKGAVTILNSLGGIGKTRLAIIAADRFAQADGKSMLWLTEDFPGQVRAIFDDLVNAGLAHKDSMRNMNLVLNEAIQMLYIDSKVAKLNIDIVKTLADSLLDNDSGLLVLDPLLSFYGGNENDNSQADIFMLGLTAVAKMIDVPVLLIHHNRKSIGVGDEDVFRGATAFHNKCRARYSLTKIKDREGIDKIKTDAGYRLLTIKKDSWGLRKYFYKLSGGKDSMEVRIAPEIKWI